MVSLVFIVFNFLLISSFFLYNSVKNKQELTLISWLNLLVFFLYGVITPTVLIGTHKGYNKSNYADLIVNMDASLVILYFLCVTVFIIFSNIAWYKKGVKLSSKRIENYDKLFVSKKIIRFSYIMFVISLFSFFLYTRAYGGFKSFLNYSIAIRSGVASVPNRFSFLEKNNQFAIISSLVFFSYILNNDKSFTRVLKCKVTIGFLISFVFNIYTLFSTGGRSPMIYYFLTLLLMYVYTKTDTLFKFLIKVGKNIVWLPLIFYVLDVVWSRSTVNSKFELFIGSFSYPLGAFLANYYSRKRQFFVNFLHIPLFFLPSKIWSSKFGILTSNDLTTYLVSGAYKGNYVGNKLVTGTTPNDIISFGYLQLGILGVIITGFLFGILLRNLQNMSFKYEKFGLKYVFISYFTVKVVIYSILGADIYDVIIRNWGFIIYFTLFSLYLKSPLLIWKKNL